MASSSRKFSNLLDDEDNEYRLKKRAFETKINDIPKINELILTLTAEKINDMINAFIQLLDGFSDNMMVEEKIDSISADCPPLMRRNLKYELYHDDEQLLKKYYFIFLSLLIKNHYDCVATNSEIKNINILLLLRLIENNNILVKFELIDHNKINYSSYFSLISTFLIIIISHQAITTQDICLFSTILQDDIINKNIFNWPVLKDFLQLFRRIVHVTFVKQIYMELINDELGPAKSASYILFTETIDKTIEEIFEQRGISFANLSTCYSAVTCFNRTLIINKNIIILSSIEHCTKLTENVIMFAGLLIIFIHEFFHILRRTMIREAVNPFYQRIPERNIASRNDIYVSDGGTQLEDRLFGKIPETIGYLDGKFLLNYDNWNDNNHENFKELFHDQQKQDLLVNQECNRWIIPNSGGFMHTTCYDQENEDDDTKTTAKTTEKTTAKTTSSSSQRWSIGQCMLSSPFFHFDN